MNLWDKKAKNYPRYSENLNSIQKQAFEKINVLGIDFSAKNIIDIGCGTGVWTLHLAKIARQITAIDNSKAMLEILTKDAHFLGLKNIKIENKSFEQWQQDNENLNFDIAFLSMSPALQNIKDYENFIHLADVRIYLGWAEARKSDLLDPILKHFNTEFKGFYKQDLESFLKEKNIHYHRFIFEEKRQAQRTREEALENALWHLDMNGIKAEKSQLEKLILNDTLETIESKIKLLVF